MAIMTSKLPTSDRPLIHDRDLAAVVERMLAPLNGNKLERAQAAIRKVANSPVQGPFDIVVNAYRAAIHAATGDKEP